MRLLAVSIGRFGGGSVRSMSKMSRRPSEPVSVISTARMLRLVSDPVQARRPPSAGPACWSSAPLPALRPPTDQLLDDYYPGRG